MGLLMRVTGAPHIENLLGNKGSWKLQAQELSVHIFDRTSIIGSQNINCGHLSTESKKLSICLKVRTCTESA